LTIQRWYDNVYLGADTSRFDFDRNGTYETGPFVIPEGFITQELPFGNASKYYLFVSDKYLFTQRLALTLGLRYDHLTYSGKGRLSPRASLSYQVVPGTGTLTLAVGEYSQTHPLPFYGDRRNIGYNRNLEPMKAFHYVLGYEHIFEHGLKMSFESYYKTYNQIAVEDDFIYSANQLYWSDERRTIGERRAYGLELYLEQKQVEDFFGTLCVSLSKTNEKDPRIPALVDWYNSDYDYPVILTAIGGKVVKGVRDWLDDAPFYLKYPSYILPLSNEMEISFKYRYQTGRVYTPQEFVTWKQDREGGVHWSKGSWISTNNINSERYPNYSRLDLQWLSRFYMKGYNINVYFALMNVFNTKNVFFENHRSDGTIETVYQFSFFPVLGVEVEY
ncbi:MAG: TonB-dependent receptor, partial [Ignavibacteriae bacterium]|nr:TonB-dependent receptor [Ignavibacteriota bacterium]